MPFRDDTRRWGELLLARDGPPELLTGITLDVDVGRELQGALLDGPVRLLPVAVVVVTGDGVFDGAVRSALRRDGAQSHAVAFVSDQSLLFATLVLALAVFGVSLTTARGQG